MFVAVCLLHLKVLYLVRFEFGCVCVCGAPLYLNSPDSKRESTQHWKSASPLLQRAYMAISSNSKRSARSRQSRALQRFARALFICYDCCLYASSALATRLTHTACISGMPPFFRFWLPLCYFEPRRSALVGRSNRAIPSKPDPP